MVLHRTRDLEDEWNKRMEVGKREYGFLRAAAGGDRHGAGESTPPKETQQHTSLHSHRATPHHTTPHHITLRTANGDTDGGGWMDESTPDDQRGRVGEQWPWD